MIITEGLGLDIMYSRILNNLLDSLRVMISGLVREHFFKD